MKKKLKLGKYAFLSFFKGDEFIWLQSDDNFKLVAKDYPSLKKIDEFRYARLVEGIRGKELEFMKPETIIDGLYFGDKVKEIYTEIYSDLKAYDMDEIIHDENGNFNYHAYLNKLPQETKRIMEEEDNFIMFEGLFELELPSGYKFSMKPDVLIKEKGILYLLEAKAVTAPKKEHGYDVVYQWNLMNELGYKIDKKNVKLITIDWRFNRPGEIPTGLTREWTYHFGNSAPDKERLETSENFTKIATTIDVVTQSFKYKYNMSFIDILEYIVKVELEHELPMSEEINLTDYFVNWRFFGKNDYEPFILEYYGAGKDSPFGIAGLTPKFDIKAIYWNKGVKDYLNMSPSSLVPQKYISEYEAEAALDFDNQLWVKKYRPGAYIQYHARKLNRLISYPENIKNELKKYKAPIYMFDFETIKFAVPENVNAWPYEQIPYQYSIHIITDPNDFDYRTGKNVIHLEWLAENINQLGTTFWEAFIKDMYKEGEGTWVSYNKSFENMVISNNLKKDFLNEETKEKMRKILLETIDLMKPFKDKDYYHPEFMGSYSIKKIGPHFAGEGQLDYEKLNYIKKGDITSREAKIWVMNQDKQEYLDRYSSLRKDMLKYCEYDTLSMVAILQGLKEKYEN